MGGSDPPIQPTIFYIRYGKLHSSLLHERMHMLGYDAASTSTNMSYWKVTNIMKPNIALLSRLEDNVSWDYPF